MTYSQMIATRRLFPDSGYTKYMKYIATFVNFKMMLYIVHFITILVLRNYFVKPDISLV